MYCISLMVVPMDMPFLSLSVAFDGLHDDINFYTI